MSLAFKRVGLIGKQRGNDSILETLQKLVSLLRARHIDLIIEKDTAAVLNDPTIPAVPGNQLGQNCDLVIVVGGDGSLLNAVHAVIDSGIPILGINRGRLGFLTDIRPKELSTKVNEILDGQFIEKKRFLLTAKIMQNAQPIFQDNALNDVVITPGTMAQMIEFEIYIDDRLMCGQRADGLIIATPTGSTAYALSGGGPILHPQLDAIVLVPMFPHTLSSRPIVVEGNCKINVVIALDNQNAPVLSCDGRKQIPITPGNSVLIQKNPIQARIIHPTDYDYFETLRDKLHWNTNW